MNNKMIATLALAAKALTLAAVALIYTGTTAANAEDCIPCIRALSCQDDCEEEES